MAAAPNKTQFALCIENKDTEDLVEGKVDRIVPDPVAKKNGFSRVIDESEEN